MSVKKKYYTMNNQEFKSHLNQLKTSDNTLHIFRDMDTPYFFVNSLDMNQSILELNKLQLKLDNIYDSLSDIQKEMVKQSCLLDEIQSTNKTENVYSTRSDNYSQK